ncbi:response regulator [bacterium]
MQDIKVLVVDDDSDYRTLLREYLHEKGLSVLEVGSEEEAVQTAVSEVPDVILLDVILPGTDGYEVCRKLKSDNRTRGIPVMMLTARVGFNDKLQGFLAGAYKYFTKPCALEEIEEAIYGVLGNNGASRTINREIEMHY